MKNSIKQMMRTPVKTGLFLLLMISAALLMTSGVCIWQKKSKTLEQYEDRFVTIGTVRQIPDSFEQTLQWNAETKDYDVVKKAQYSSYYTVADLNLPGLEYIVKPEQRAFYCSYTPEYLKLWRSLNPSRIATGSLIAEFSPLEDCIPSESIQIQITKVIGGDERMEGTVEWFCDHMNPEPEMLYHDKTYVAILDSYLYIHGKAYDDLMGEKTMYETRVALEYIPASLEADIYLSDGSKQEDAFRNGQEIFEVTEGFYETDAGTRILNLAQMEGCWQYMQPVTGTNMTCLLMPFYNGDAYISEGRDISEEEYAAGEKVCLAPRTFMNNNGLSLGDKVKVQLLCTDTRLNAGRRFWIDGSVSAYGSMIDVEGNPLEVFEASEYEVVGIYDVTISNTDSIFNLGADELIVPMESIEAREGINLLSCGPMTDTTSSFRIPNGTIDEFLKTWAEFGTDNLEFTFYDRGYSKLKAGIDNMKNLSFFLLVVGVILTGLLLFFFSHMFITKQAHRTAIERSLGMNTAQCRWSMLSGFVLLILVGSIVGSVAGAKISGSITVLNAGRNYYSTVYTVGNTNAFNEIDIDNLSDMGLPAVCCTVLITLTGVGIALGRINKSLKREPMQLLSERWEG